MSRFLYQKQSFLLIKRDESCITRPEFELIWVAVEVPHQHNIVCGLIYRHPGTKLDKTVAEKLNSEGKYYLLMGEFINKVLNCDSETEVFVNTLGSYAFHPQLLRPTRITNHPATLIDNIFFNYLEHHVVSRGNIGSVVSLIIWLIFLLLTSYLLFLRTINRSKGITSRLIVRHL